MEVLLCVSYQYNIENGCFYFFGILQWDSYYFLNVSWNGLFIVICYGVVFYDYSGSVDLCFMIDVDGVEDILLNNKCVVINWYGIGVILLVSSYIIILLSVDI